MNTNLNFRTLNADEIEVRVGAFTKDQTKASYLLYKDARVDMRLLDETFGPFGWQRSHSEVDGKVYCTVSIKSPEGEWISKSDAGSESRTEAVKGEASDSFKRACFNWGIGRELYTAPTIWVQLAEDEKQYGARLHVSHIAYTDGVITELELRDRHNNIRYDFGMGARRRAENQEAKVLRESFFDNRERLDNMLAQMEECYRAKPDSFTILRFLQRHHVQCESDAVMTRLREIWMHHINELGL